jgi:two-component system, chemotaxis family, protein-glutamate methylesterase/glutaminase
MPRDVVVIGASAGGLEALRSLLRELPADLPATVLVVVHLPAYGTSSVPAILAKATSLPVHEVAGPTSLEPGQVLVAPPAHHLVITDDWAELSRGPKENGFRPAADVLFRTAAWVHGSRVIGVVLSGALDDGTAGLHAVAQRGGLTVVQDPSDALNPGMPGSVLAQIAVDHVLPAAEIGRRLAGWCAQQVSDTAPVPGPELIAAEAAIALLEPAELHDPHRPGVPAGFSCPDCAGTLFVIHDDELVRYRCRVGHAWSAESLLGEQAVQLDGALWTALRTLEEKAVLADDLADRAERRGGTRSAGRFRDQADEARHAAGLIRGMLDGGVGQGVAESTASVPEEEGRHRAG